MVVEYLHPPSSWVTGQLRKLIYNLWVWTQKSPGIFPNQTLTASLTHTWILSSNQRPLFDLLTNQRPLYDQSEASVMGSSCILLATVFLITLANTPTLVHYITLNGFVSSTIFNMSPFYDCAFSILTTLHYKHKPCRGKARKHFSVLQIPICFVRTVNFLFIGQNFRYTGY